MANQTTPCDVCPEHRDGAPTVIAEHEFARQEEPWPLMPDVHRYRWVCSCGRRGQWQSQSPDVAYHAWLRHCGVPDDYTGEGR